MVLRHTASTHLCTSLPLLDFHFPKLPASKGWWWSDHITSSQGRKRDKATPMHTFWVDVDNYHIFIYFILCKKEALFFQKESHLPLSSILPPPSIDYKVCRLSVCQLTCQQTNLANKQTVELSLIFSVSVAGCRIRILQLLLWFHESNRPMLCNLLVNWMNTLKI